MPFALSSGDRKLLISAVVMLVILILVASVFAPQNPASVSYPSSYSAASDGAKATFVLLQELGYNVERWEDSPTALPKDPRGMVLILADPFGAATPEERHALNRFLLDGGRVLVTGYGARFLPDSDSSYNSGLKDYSWQNFPAVLPSPLTRGAREISLLPWTKWGTRYPGQVALYGNRGASPVAVMYPVGKGEVVWVSASIPLMNAGIDRANNLEFLMNVAGPRPGRILWDEYFHGYGKSLTDYLARTPVPWGLAQCGLVFLAAVFAYSRRSGPVRPLPVESRLSPVEFIETLGGLYQKAHAGQAAVEAAYRRFRFVIAKRYGLPVNATDEQIARAGAKATGVPEAEVLDMLRRCESASMNYDLEDKEALRLVQTLHGYRVGVWGQ
jgi:hypothetical protein